MSVFITSFQLLNFQSWNDTAAPINLESDIVNIIEGKNETGKSVIFKVLKDMCFPGYWKAASVIRRGCSKAVCIVYLSSGSAVAYELGHKYHIHYLISETETKSWRDSPFIPQEVQHAMGLILDKESRSIVNVIDKDTPTLFVASSPRLNASILRAVVEPEDMQTFFSNAQETSERLKYAIKQFTQAYRIADAKQAMIKYTDIDSVLVTKDRLDSYAAVVAPLSSLHDSIKKIADHAATAPDAVLSVEHIAPSILAAAEVRHVLGSVHALKSVYASKPAQNPINPDAYRASLAVLQEMQSISADVKSGYDFTMRIQKLPHGTLPSKEDVAVLQQFESLLSGVSELRSVLQTKEAVQNSADSALNEIQQIEREVGVCPTCGKLL